MILRTYYVIEWRWAAEPAQVFWTRTGRFASFEEAVECLAWEYHGEQVSRVIKITEEVVSQ
jgi:hypothetical protein